MDIDESFENLDFEFEVLNTATVSANGDTNPQPRPQLHIRERKFVIDRVIRGDKPRLIMNEFKLQFDRTLPYLTLRKIKLKWEKYCTLENRNKGNSGKKGQFELLIT